MTNELKQVRDALDKFKGTTFNGNIEAWQKLGQLLDPHLATLDRMMAAQPKQPDVNAELLECLNDAISLWDAQNPLNEDDIKKWREVSKQSKANIEYIADAIVKAIADILYLYHTYEKKEKFKRTIDDLTIVLNRLGLNEDDDRAEQKACPDCGGAGWYKEDAAPVTRTCKCAEQKGQSHD